MPDETNTPIRIAIADDHALFREGVKFVLSRHPQTVCVGEAGGGDALLEVVNATHPDVIVMDLTMPQVMEAPDDPHGVGQGADGAATFVRRLQDVQPNVRILVLTADRDFPLMMTMIRAGVHGYLLKDDLATTLVEAIEAVAAGNIWLPPALAARIVQYLTSIQPTEPTAPTLTTRQEEVLSLLAAGKAIPQIAEALGISKNAVNEHLKVIYRKMGVHSRSEATVKYLFLRRPASPTGPGTKD